MWVVIERGEHTPLWLSHHWPHDFDRCIEVRGRKVCRRCSVLYPVGILSAVVLAHVATWPSSIDLWLVVLLPFPAFVEMVGEHAGWWRPSPSRLIAFAVVQGIGCGRLYVRYLHDHADPVPFVVIFGYGFALIAAVLLSARRRSGAAGVEAAEPLHEVAGVAEGAGVVAGEARGGQHGQQGEGEAQGPAGEAEPGHR